MRFHKFKNHPRRHSIYVHNFEIYMEDIGNCGLFFSTVRAMVYIHTVQGHIETWGSYEGWKGLEGKLRNLAYLL
jgi:hypothetical protein